MSNRNSNFPTNGLKNLDGDKNTGVTVKSLFEMSKLGIPQSDQELTERIESYFEHCVQTNSRPGIEQLALSLSTSRQNFWLWCKGEGGKSKEWMEQCLRARQTIIAFLESAGLNGKINPVSLIFLLKQWAGYEDGKTVTIEHTAKIAPTLDDIPLFDDSEEGLNDNTR